jgi:hypothetical protein
MNAAYRGAAAALYERCQPKNRGSGYERFVIRILWSQFARIESRETVLTVYAANMRAFHQTGIAAAARATLKTSPAGLTNDELSCFVKASQKATCALNPAEAPECPSRVFWACRPNQAGIGAGS